MVSCIISRFPSDAMAVCCRRREGSGPTWLGEEWDWMGQQNPGWTSVGLEELYR